MTRAEPPAPSALEDRLRALAPRAVSVETRRIVAERLVEPRRRRAANAAAALAWLTAAALGAAAVTIGLGGGRPGASSRPSADDRDLGAPSGCDCRVRFLRLDPVRPTGRTTAPVPLDPGRRTTLRS